MDIQRQAERVAFELGEALVRREWSVATAESCTGGLIANTLTNVPGSSRWFRGAVVAYANDVKTALLGVGGSVLAAHGAVSRETVEAMAPGACRAVGTQCAVAVSGIAGPDGGTPDKPVGTVWIGWSVDGVVSSQMFHFAGDRDAVKAQTAQAAIEGLLQRVG
ncbi:CinA family protein [Desulfobaculum sp.]